MVRVTEELALSSDNVTLYHAADPLLGHLPLLLFHGPSTTANYTLNSSRVQVHVFTPAGFQSFPRITISPNSPFYGVVHHLPREAARWCENVPQEPIPHARSTSRQCTYSVQRATCCRDC
ncbi:hypothetical protein LB505_004908 [Fusarium chuoi]|nr:hypothetical protein LB505_004908 [Fusarium chuoi]